MNTSRVLSDLELAFGQALNLGFSEIFQGLLLALVLGVGVAALYRVSVPGRVLSPAMSGSMVLLSIIASMVMMVIGNNIARAFSLVGALAIIRFRTRLRSPWDITFVFLSLSVGIACGVFAFRVAVMGTAVIALTVLVMQAHSTLRQRNGIQLLRCDLAAYEAREEAIAGVLDAHLKQRWLVEARSLRFGETLSYRYRVVLKEPNGTEALLQALSAVEGVERVVVYQDADHTSEME
ncbi:MAG: DUF4956 domain-containing protein [Deltaproteobacteria bacterium]|nr:DUF4956 domain-containing protein [Deltaproteobacteria bacterium]